MCADTSSSLVIDHLQVDMIPRGFGVGYFYFDYRDHAKQTPARFAASVIRQLASQMRHFPQQLTELYQLNKLENAYDLQSQLSLLLVEICVHFKQTFIIVDALDECPKGSQLTGVLNILSQLVPEKTRIFMTTRPHLQGITALPKDAAHIQIQAHDIDLKAYCYSVIDANEMTSGLIDGELREEVASIVADKADGTFLLAVLQMRTISEAMTKTEVRKALRLMSSDLGQAFEETILRVDRAPPNQRKVAQNALMWVSRAQRPLSVKELCHALATDLGDTELDDDNILFPRTIIETSCGLLIVDDEGLTIRLVHLALKEHLQSRGGAGLKIKEETYITQILLTYLCFKVFDLESIHSDENFAPQNDHGRKSPKLALLKYAAGHWGVHKSMASTPDTHELALRFLKSPEYLARALASNARDTTQAWPLMNGSPLNTLKHVGLHVAAGFGLLDLVESLLEEGYPVNAIDNDKATALHKAVSQRRVKAAKALIRHGANVNLREKAGNTPIFLAVTNSDKELVSMLLMAGASVHDTCLDGWSPLQRAADNGHLGIVELLLNYGASVIDRSARGLIPLHRAAGRGHLEVMEALIRVGSPINQVTYDNWTPLHGASSTGKHLAVKMLLDHGAEIDAISQDGRTPLLQSAREGHPLTIEVLLGRSPNLMVVDRFKQNCLHRAAGGGHKRVAELLLDHDESLRLRLLTSRKWGGLTPTEVAFANGHWEVGTYLQQREASLTGSSCTQPSELHAAVIANDYALVKELVARGTDVNDQDANGFSPLQLAILLENDAIAELLLHHKDIDIALSTALGWQALHCAAKARKDDLVRLCLNKGAHVNAATVHGHTALHRACFSKSVDVTELLLDHGADIEARDEISFGPLATAAGAGSIAVVRLLIERGADSRARDSLGRKVRAVAASGAQYGVTEYLRQLEPLTGHREKRSRVHSRKKEEEEGEHRQEEDETCDGVDRAGGNGESKEDETAGKEE